MQQHELVILSARGDTRVTWDLDAEEAVREAERIFDENRARGFASFRVATEPGEEPAQIHQFDPHARQILQFPPMAGG